MNIINNLSLGNIESDSDMTALYRDLMSIISRKRLREDDSKRLQSYYDAAEKRLITYAMSNIKLTEAKIKTAENSAKDFQNEIRENNSAKNEVIGSWLGNMALSCVSFFMGDVFSVEGMIFNSNESEAKSSFKKFNEVWRPVLRRDPYKLEVEKYNIRELAKNLQENSSKILDALEIVRDNTPKEDWPNNLFAGTAFFVMGDKEQGIECVELNVDFEYENEISKILLNQMKKGNLDAEATQDIMRSMELGELLKNMNTTDKELALVMADFFEGRNIAEQNLERLSKSTDNPIVFHALRLIEQSKGNSQNYSKILGYLKKFDELNEKVADCYSDILPIVNKYVEDDRENAKIFMADMLQFGLGVEQDMKKAGEIFASLAQIGTMYRYGWGVERDLQKAREWYQKAADQGNNDARISLDNLNKTGK